MNVGCIAPVGILNGRATICPADGTISVAMSSTKTAANSGSVREPVRKWSINIAKHQPQNSKVALRQIQVGIRRQTKSNARIRLARFKNRNQAIVRLINAV